MSTTDLDLGPVRIVPKGAYSASATYELLNMVSYEGSSWLMKASSYVVGTTPEEGDTWTLLAQRGETGAAGTNGQDGANGQDGSDATVPDASTTVAGKVQLATDTEISVGTNLTKAVTPKGLADKVAAALASLVNSAPETLDTLNELAAALGDDPNFATTVATNIGTVSTAASVAQTTANSAVSAASAAQSDADAAQSTADTALANAATAQSTANTAVSNAATAQSAATAIATTDTLGRVSVNGGLSITDAGALSISMDVQDVIDDASALLDDVSISAGVLKVVRSDNSGKIESGYLPFATTAEATAGTSTTTILSPSTGAGMVAVAQSAAEAAQTTANAALPKAGGTMTGGLVGTTVVANTSVSCPSLVLNGWTVTVSS